VAAVIRFGLTHDALSMKCARHAISVEKTLQHSAFVGKNWQLAAASV
jgi:hypothetical protein